MICSKCGKKVLMGAKYCTNCGTEVEHSESKQSVSQGSIPITQSAKGGKGTLRKIIVIGCAAVVLMFLLLICSGSTGGTVNTYSIEENVTEWCAQGGCGVDSVDVEYRGSFLDENGYTLEVYDITVDVLGEGKGKVLFSYIVGENTVKLEAYYPSSLLREIFGVGLMPDFETESFSDEDIAAFAEKGFWFDPDAQ